MVLKANKKRQGRDVLGAMAWDEAVKLFNSNDGARSMLWRRSNYAVVA
jgi:hypothetical protein